MINLGLIEDDPLLLKNYIDFFTMEPEFQVSFSLNDVGKLNTLKNSCFADIILLDLILPSGNSLNYLHKITQRFPRSRIIILSGISDQATSQSALQRGANGFLLKSSSLYFIKDALIKTSEGGTPLSPSIANHLIYYTNSQTLFQAYPDLTKREIELIYLLKTGMSNKMAAFELKVTFFTINQHLKNVYKKLKINSRGELIAITNKY